MINHLRHRLANLLSTADTVVLATAGPAGVQARSFRCQSQGTILYLLLPGTSDHLLNLEHDDEVLVSTPGWQVRGRGRVLPLLAAPVDLGLSQSPAADGCVLLEIHPRQLQVYRMDGWGFSETLDIEPDANNLT
jgi:hypothetical protein